MKRAQVRAQKNALRSELINLLSAYIGEVDHRGSTLDQLAARMESDEPEMSRLFKSQKAGLFESLEILKKVLSSRPGYLSLISDIDRILDESPGETSVAL